MAQLRPIPFDVLVARMFGEHESRQQIFDLPATAFVRPDPTLDYSVSYHGRPVATPLGPAAGPHTQLAQNILLSWLAGGRIIELKTVQANDRIAVPRPCIDMRTVGFNVEWSQELTLDESLEEYVKGSMLIELLAASGRLDLAAGFERFVFEVSVGYDLAGVASEPVQSFLRRMQDARPIVDRLRREIPSPWRRYADVAFSTRLAAGVTLSTFHGCPPGDVGRMATLLLQSGFPTVLKLNPTLLGCDDTRRLLHDQLGYTDIHLLPDAFDQDLQWDDLRRLVPELEGVAAACGVAFGVKLTNTLVVANDGEFLPANEPRRYMSGPPLHLLAMELVRRFRREFGAQVPVSFSGGIDAVNFPDAVALGLLPVTVCTDLLKPGGYARGQKYFRELSRRMKAAGAQTIDAFVAAYVPETSVPAGDLTTAALRNTEHYVSAAHRDARYARAHHARPPRKIGRALSLFDCLACAKCVPVCPNDAVFMLSLCDLEIPREMVRQTARGWQVHREGENRIAEPSQVAIFADACNACGNCDVFCPEDGGPYRLKPRFFGSERVWDDARPADGFCLALGEAGESMLCRLDGHEYRVAWTAGGVRFVGDGFDLAFSAGAEPLEVRAGSVSGDVDLTPYRLADVLRRAILAQPGTNFVNASRRGSS